MFGSELPILPETLKKAVFGALRRVFGILLLAFALFGIIIVLSNTNDMQTWTNISTYPQASFLTKIVDIFAYAIGCAPLLFILLFLIRTSIYIILGKSRDHPEMSAMQVFIAAMFFSAGLAFILPNQNAGGVFGAFVFRDFHGSIGRDIIIGTFFMSVFIVLASIASKITLSSFLRFFYRIGAGTDWIFRKIFSRKEMEYSESSFIEKPIKNIARKKTRKLKRYIVKKLDENQDENSVEYQLPSPEFLLKSNFSSSVVTREHRDIAESMEINFEKYGILGKVREIHPGPIITRYDFEPEDGQKINKIMETATDMRRAMATEQIRIALVPRTRYIGVEMVNPNRQYVHYQSLMSNPDFMDSEMKIPLALGVEISGKPFYADLAKMPHILIAGRTGSGKSVFVQSIITSIVYHSTPDECKLIIVDPKGVDFNKWRDIPHLITPIVTEAGAAVNVLKWAVREMEDRYKELQLVEAQNIADYNKLADKMNAAGKTFKKKVPVGTNEEGQIEYETQEVEMQNMPYIVLIMDEIADLMQQARKDVEACIQRITQKARAAGIHLVAATQRPDTSVITGVIKSNLPTRISFQARSYIDSMTTLGERGAEMLLAQGDMLYSESGKQPIRIHGALIQDKETDKIAKFLRAQAAPDYVEGITEVAAEISNSILGLSPGKGDNEDLYSQAVEIVLRDKKPTISYVQRRLSIGYNKAALLIERMEAAGIIVRQPNGKYEIV